MSEEYDEYCRDKQKEWEELCIRCGGCCGSFDDPCFHLAKDKDDKYFCRIYNNRFGVHTSESGEEHDCVNIREIIDTPWKNDYLCPYKKKKRKANGA